MHVSCLPLLAFNLNEEIETRQILGKREEGQFIEWVLVPLGV